MGFAAAGRGRGAAAAATAPAPPRAQTIAATVGVGEQARGARRTRLVDGPRGEAPALEDAVRHPHARSRAARARPTPRRSRSSSTGPAGAHDADRGPRGRAPCGLRITLRPGSPRAHGDRLGQRPVLAAAGRLAGLLRVGVAVAREEALLERADAGLRRLGLLEGDLARLERADQALDRLDLRVVARCRPPGGRSPPAPPAPRSAPASSASRRAFISRSSVTTTPVVAQLLAQQARRRPAARASPAARRRSRARGRATVMTRRDAGLDRRAERPQLDVLEPRSASGRPRAGRGASRRRCRRGPGSAWRRPRRRSPASPRIIAAPEPAHEVGVVAERAVADHGVLRVRVHVHARARSRSGCRRP